MDTTRTVSGSQNATPSRAPSVLRNQMDELYNGDLSLKQEPLYRTVRIYLSAELSDSAVEKYYLARHVYPKLRQLCQSLGLQCVVVDLFRAVPAALIIPPSEASTTSDNMAYKLEARGLLEMARDEIKLCQEFSLGPSFVTLLAQRYGHKALHKCIPEDHFKLFLAAVDEPGMKQLMTQWYREDTNAHPPQYVLQSHRGMSAEKWGSIHQSLSRTTRKAAKVALGKDISIAQQYTMSVIEEEVSLGIFQMTQDPNQSCVWLRRTFTDLLEQRPSADTALADYTDLTEGKRGLEFDQDTFKILNHLKEARMPAKYVGLESTNIFEFSLKWQRGQGVSVEAHADYLSQLSEQLLTTLESMVSHGNTTLLAGGGCDDETHEILCHANYCRKQNIGFMDRPSVTTRILDYLTSTSATPLVLYGCVGSGKTSLMAGVANRLRAISSLKKAAIVLRFVRATSNAHSVRHLLLDICKQLCVVYRQEVGQLPRDYRCLCQSLVQLLSYASTDKPLILLLDGVDELSPEDGALGLSWLPLKLPEHVKIVLSTSSENRYSCYPVVQSLLANQQESFVEVPELSRRECRELLHHCLRNRGRSLTIPQERVVLDALHGCRNPLYLQLLLREVTTWHSYQWNSSWTPAADLPGAVKQLLSELEAQLGQVFVRSALGYVTASGDGLTEMELLDVLSTDTEVMREVNRQWCLLHPPNSTLTSIPPLLMAMFHRAVRPLLDYHSGCGGVLVLRWSHRILHEVTESTYFSYRPTAQARYNSLASYFTGVGSASRSAGETGPVFEQPVVVDSDLGLYNVRKLRLLPRLLTLAQRHYDLQRLLVDYEWIKGSIVGSSVLDLVAEFAAVLPLVPLARSAGSSDSQYELVLLRDALSQSVSVLSHDQHSLPSQLLGRLMPYVRDSLTWQWPNLKSILLRAFSDHSPIFTPVHPLFHLPGGPLLVTMEGHRGPVTGLATTVVRCSPDDTLNMVVISSSQDKTLKSWDVKSTGVIKTFDGHIDKVLCAALTLNGRYAVSGSADHTIRHWVVGSAECVCVLRGHSEAVEAVVITREGHKTVSASFDCTIKVWNTDTDSKTYGQVIFTLDSSSPLTALSLCLGDQWVISLRQDGHVALTDIISGEERRVVGREAITAITTARVEWFKYLLTGTVTGEVVVKEWVSMETSRVLRPPNHDEPVLAVAAGYKVVASYKIMGLVVWDLLSGAHLYSLTGGEGVVYTLTLADQGDLLLTGGNDQRVRIWDLKRSGDTRSISQHQGAVLSVVLSPCGHYGLSAGEDSMVKVYELTTMKIVGEMQADGVKQLFGLRDGKHFLTSSSEGRVTLWDGEKGTAVQEFGCRGERLTCVAMTMDAELLVAGSNSGKLLFWNASSGQRLKTINSHDSSVVSISFAKGADFNCIVSTSKSGELCIRNFFTGKISLQYHFNSAEITCSAVNASGSLLAVGSVDSNCYILAIPSGQRRSFLEGHTLMVTGVTFAPDTTQCFTSSLDKTIRLFNIASGDCTAVFQTDLPITCIDSDVRGETIFYGTSEGWVSMAHCQLGSNRDNPLVRMVKGELSTSSVILSTTFSVANHDLI